MSRWAYSRALLRMALELPLTHFELAVLLNHLLLTADWLTGRLL